MSWTGRLRNLFRGARVDRELDEEMASHLAEAVERGRTEAEARRAFGGVLQTRERSRDIRLVPWLEALGRDVVFGWRQLRRNRAATAAAVLSLGLAIGATTAAFRLVDAVLWRSLPVAEPDRLLFLATTGLNREGRPDYHDDFDYPTFREYSKVLQDRADLMVVGMAGRLEAELGPGQETEKVTRQYVSGNMFGALGLRPVVGRLLAPDDDSAAGGKAVAVVSYDFWARRFARDPRVLGRTIREGSRQYEIVGVAPKGFTGTEPGAMTDVYLPATLRTEALNSPGWSWFRIWVRPRAGISPEQVRQPLQAWLTLRHQEELKRFAPDTPRKTIEGLLSESVVLFPAASGASELQKEYRRPLLILGVLVALVLLVACANVGNLLTAQAAARSREMALRVSIGAGQGRLVQLVIVESALLAILASAVGVVFAWWSAPLVVGMLAQPEEPVRLALNTDWRALGFGAALAAVVTLLFGLGPALRASAVKPVSALKGGEDPHARRRWMHSLVAAQMAFCVMVQFVAGLFVTTFERLSNRPLGFAPQRVLVLGTEIQGKKQSPEIWMQVTEQLRQTPGVEAASVAGWALLSDNRWRGRVRIPGSVGEARSPYMLDVAPGFFETMRIGLIGGRDFRAGDKALAPNDGAVPVAGVGIVNEAFAREYLDGQNPVGRVLDQRGSGDASAPLQIVGYVRDASYNTVREPIHPTLYLPFQERKTGTILVRTAGDPRAFAASARRAVTDARSEFRVRNVETQSALVERQLLRERLLATLSLFFAAIALLLAAIGLYGVLNYSVIQQRREIGIRMALGARPGHVVRRVTSAMFAVVALGSAIGLAAGIASARFVESLLFEVKPTDVGMVAAPLAALFGAALLAALPPAIRAAGTDPARILRSE